MNLCSTRSILSAPHRWQNPAARTVRPGGVARPRQVSRRYALVTCDVLMRMRQSLAQYEAAFREEAVESVQRREQLRRQAATRSRVRRIRRIHKAGTFRFVLLCLTILATTVIVTVAMFQALALLAG